MLLTFNMKQCILIYSTVYFIALRLCRFGRGSFLVLTAIAHLTYISRRKTQPFLSFFAFLITFFFFFCRYGSPPILAPTWKTCWGTCCKWTWQRDLATWRTVWMTSKTTSGFPQQTGSPSTSERWDLGLPLKGRACHNQFVSLEACCFTTCTSTLSGWSPLPAKVQRTRRHKQLWWLWRGGHSCLANRKMCKRVCWLLGNWARAPSWALLFLGYLHSAKG